MKNASTMIVAARVGIVLAGCMTALAGPAQPGDNWPTITVFRDDTVIRESCRVVIPPDTVIEDVNGDGVMHIAAEGITVEFVPTAAVLRGSRRNTPYDEMSGVGIRIDGKTNVTLLYPQVHGFRVGIWATQADGLVIRHADVSEGFAHHLRSTPQAEDGGDWLWPHRNDNREWMQNYGAGVCVEQSSGVTISDLRARRRQNGIMLDRVTDSFIYDCDASFLSGWGLAMWRSSRNVITRNAFDFCVRGYSHGVYNRGQDSAGILMFEQCSENVFAENSATHGGDGVFGFAGREALGEIWLERERERLRGELGRRNVDDAIEYPPAVLEEFRRRGCNDNLFINNDLSYAPAHGLEMTFSFGNVILQNRMVGNAICGIWGGYSQDTLIASNVFEGNGEMGYGLERGGVNIEHSRGTRILHNEFSRNRAGVHLWWDPDGGFARMPWAKANGTDTRDNLIAGNTFNGDQVGIHMRLTRDRENPEAGVSEAWLAGNTFTDVGERIRTEEGVVLREESDVAIPAVEIPPYRVMGTKQPVGARDHLRGREKIVMTEWFPWDHMSPLVREVSSTGTEVVYEVHGVAPEHVGGAGQGVRFRREGGGEGSWRYIVTAQRPGVHPYTITVESPNYTRQISGTLLSVVWDVTVFSWESIRGEGPVPPPDLEKWRAQASGPSAVTAQTGSLRFAFGGGGPSQVKISEEVTTAGFRGDYFGLIARTTLPLPAGKWRVSTRSDDGVRVMVNGKTVIENWTHHGAAVDRGEFTMDADGEAEIVVEYFEIFGAAVLEFEIEAVK